MEKQLHIDSERIPERRTPLREASLNPTEPYNSYLRSCRPHDGKREKRSSRSSSSAEKRGRREHDNLFPT